MEEVDKGYPMIKMGVSGRVFLLVPAYRGSPGSKAVKRLCLCVCVCVCNYLMVGLITRIIYLVGSRKASS